MGTSRDRDAADASASLPLEVRWLRAHGLRGLTPWCFIDREDRRENLRAEFRKEVGGGSQPERDFLPFARRQDEDTVAGFVVDGGKVGRAVIAVHLTCTGRAEREGFPSVERYRDIWEWLKAAIDETAGWCSEDAIPSVPGDPGG